MGKNKSHSTDRIINIDVSTLREDADGNWIKPEKQKNSEAVPEKDWIVIKSYLDKAKADSSKENIDIALFKTKNKSGQSKN